MILSLPQKIWRNKEDLLDVTLPPRNCCPYLAQLENTYTELFSLCLTPRHFKNHKIQPIINCFSCHQKSSSRPIPLPASHTFHVFSFSIFAPPAGINNWLLRKTTETTCDVLQTHFLTEKNSDFFYTLTYWPPMEKKIAAAVFLWILVSKKNSHRVYFCFSLSCTRPTTCFFLSPAGETRAWHGPTLFLGAAAAVCVHS